MADAFDRETAELMADVRRRLHDISDRLLVRSKYDGQKLAFESLSRRAGLACRAVDAIAEEHARLTGVS